MFIRIFSTPKVNHPLSMSYIFPSSELKRHKTPSTSTKSCSFKKVMYYSFFLHSILYCLCGLSCCPVQLERVAAAASQVPRSSPKCPGCSHSVGHLWARQNRRCWRNHSHPVWQIWVSLTYHVFCFFLLIE